MKLSLWISQYIKKDTILQFLLFLQENTCGDLEKPVTINLIHSNGNEIQFAKYQLNTLDLTGPTKNYFWYSPMYKLFSFAKYEYGVPTVKDLNSDPAALMCAFMMRN